MNEQTNKLMYERTDGEGLLAVFGKMDGYIVVVVDSVTRAEI